MSCSGVEVYEVKVLVETGIPNGKVHHGQELVLEPQTAAQPVKTEASIETAEEPKAAAVNEPEPEATAEEEAPAVTAEETEEDARWEETQEKEEETENQPEETLSASEE